MWFIYFRVNLQETKFDNVFRAQNASNKVGVGYVDVKVRNQAVTCYLKVRGFLNKKHGTRDVFKDRKIQRSHR